MKIEGGYVLEGVLPDGHRSGPPPYWILIPFFGIFVTIGFGMIGIGARTKTGCPLMFGSFFGGMPLAMSLALMGYVALTTACAFTPAAQERLRSEDILRTLPNVVDVKVGCEGSWLATDRLCADVVMSDGAKLRFEHVGRSAFGSTTANVFVSEAGGLVPRIASCQGVGAPNFNHDGPVGHHFGPTLLDLKDAVTRYREVLEEVEFWPQCPQYWEVQRHGANYRYCARKAGALEEPPMPATCR